MPKYGLISEIDGKTIEKTIDLIYQSFDDKILYITEVGIYGGETANGICQFILGKGLGYNYTGIDNNRDKELNRFPNMFNRVLIGNSTEVYNNLKDNSQHFIFIDGLHTFAGVVADFYCFSPKVKKGGYIAFHDTGKHILPNSGWQGVGDKDDPDMCLGGVRKALNKLGLLRDIRFNATMEYTENTLENWYLIFDEADINDQAGGICVFQKLF